MILSSSYDNIRWKITKKELERGTNLPITVGIILADPRHNFVKENVLSYLYSYNKKTGELIDFYMPGFCSEKEKRNIENDSYYNSVYHFEKDASFTYNGIKYYFCEQTFVDFIDIFSKKHDMKYLDDDCQIILFNYDARSNHDYDGFDIDEFIYLPVEKWYKENKIRSFRSIMNKIIDVSKKHVDIKEFKKRYVLEILKSSINTVLQNTGISINIVKNQ